jgi:predicted nucleic acid-binding protein
MIIADTWMKNMAERAKVLLDLNVILDVLTRREPHFANSAAVWKFVEGGQVEGFIAAHSLPTLHYLYTNQTSRERAILALRQLLQVFNPFCQKERRSSHF